MTEHKNIYAAIAAAVGEIKQLGKSDRNKFDGYDFVSIDKFLKMVNPICATHGLFPSISMTDCQLYENTNSKGGKATWARFYYNISLHHATGETFGPQSMMVAVPMNGAQASGSAQSYALKQFFRGTFMIPTGDKDDADLNPTEEHTRVIAPAPKPEPVKPEARDPVKIADGIIGTIAKIATIPEIEAYPADGSKAAAAWDWLELEAPAEAARVKQAHDKRKNDLAEAPF